jgi:oxygen-independent coproporphyrinogen-3 oxidase
MHPWEAYQGTYIHIPFCQHKCSYCDFTAYQGQGEMARKQYVKTLIREIESYQPDLPVQKGATVYFGGGTPSLLSLEEVEALIKAMKERGFWNHPREVTFEANPGSVDEAYLKGLYSLGIDRLSLGIQSLVDEELRLMGRTHSAEEAKKAIVECRQAGFRRLTCDLIYGFPTQTLQSVTKSLSELVALRPTHISIYGLSVEEGTLLYHHLQKGDWMLPSEDSSGAMYDYIMKFLPKAGYERYEISNFAMPGEESRHNEIYWRYEPYMAFGAGATRFNGSRRETNPVSLIAYEKGEKPIVEQLSPETIREEMIFMNLRMARGLSLDTYKTRFGRSFEKDYASVLEDLIQKRWGVLENGYFHLTPLGMQYGNLAFEAFITTEDSAV